MPDHTHSAFDVDDVAREHHRHYDLESQVAGLREDLGRAEERIRELEDGLLRASGLVSVLEARIDGLEEARGD